MARPQAAARIERHYPGTRVATGTVVFSTLMQVETGGHNYSGEIVIVDLTFHTGGKQFAVECYGTDNGEPMGVSNQMYDFGEVFRFERLSEAAASVGL
jgi:hypothetical protein